MCVLNRLTAATKNRVLSFQGWQNRGGIVSILACLHKREGSGLCAAKANSNADGNYSFSGHLDGLGCVVFGFSMSWVRVWD